MAKVVYNHPIEKEMINVVNLTPGASADILFFRVHFYDLKTHAFPLKDPDNGENDFYCGWHEMCRWSISDTYFKETLDRAEYAVFATCGYRGGWDGIAPGTNIMRAFCFARHDLEDPKGIYIDLSCSTELGIDNKGDVITLKFRLGQLLKLTLLNYARSHLGMQHAYNEASSEKLVKFHGRNGWRLRMSNCKAAPDAAAAATADDADDQPERYLEMITTGKYKKSKSSSYPMRLCNYNFNVMFAELFQHTVSVVEKIEALGLDLKDFCVSG